MADQKQKVLIIGAGGGREHAIGWKIAQSLRAGEIFFAPGNAGTAQIGTNVNIVSTDIPKLTDYAEKGNFDLVLVVADDPLALGMVDALKDKKIRVWGPTQTASKLEWSKAFAKEFMLKHKIPTAKHKTFTDFEKASAYVQKQNYPLAVKASGLAAGKGVTIAQNEEEAVSALRKMFVDKVFGDSGNEVVIEEYLYGTEISIHALSDGIHWQLLPSSQDHKRIYDDNMGPNTGGMGTIAPLSFVNKKMMKRIGKEIIEPVIAGMAKEGTPFIGCFYPGIMLTPDGPKVFEFNTRFGDPEAQTYMRLLETDILDIIDASLYGTLDDLKIKWYPWSACTIVLASAGYPGAYEKGKIISGIKEAEKKLDVTVFHAGTKEQEGKLITNGGRILGVSATGDNLKEALKNAYKAIDKIKFEGMQYRKDIGKNALKYGK